MHTHKKEKMPTLFSVRLVPNNEAKKKGGKRKKRENFKKELEKALLSFQIMATTRALYKRRSADG